MSNSLQPIGNFLVSFSQELDKVFDDILVATIEECSRHTRVARTPGTTDTMDVVVNVGRKIVVDDVSDIRDIKSSSSNCGGNHDGSASSSERLESRFTLALSAVAMDGSSRKIVSHQKVAEHIGHAFGLDKNKGQSEILLGLGCKNIEENAALVIVFHVLDFLCDVLRGASNSSNAEEDVILEEIFGEHLDVTWEGGTEHEGLTLGGAWHIFALNDTTNLGLETHVQHTIGFIKDEVLDVGETDTATFDEINEATGSSTQEITATLDLAKLEIDIGSSVNNGWSDPGAISKLAGLLMDLGHEFAGGGENESSRVRFARATVALSRLVGGCAGTLSKGSRQNREQETTSLS
jgi:hypothetical protein